MSMNEECTQPLQDYHSPLNSRVSDKMEKSKDRNWKGRGGHVKVVDLLSVEKYADVINKASDSDGATPLMRCCETGAEECAELLLERGADINAENVRNGILLVTEEKLRQEKQDVSPVVVETAAVVLEEEFGNIDLAQEIARLKLETRGGRIPE
eukprot:gene8098-9622_t